MSGADPCQSCQFCRSAHSYVLYLDASGAIKQGLADDGGWRAWTVGEPFASHDVQNLFRQVQEGHYEIVVADASQRTSLAHMQPERLAQGLSLAQEIGRGIAERGVLGLQTSYTIKHLAGT